MTPYDPRPLIGVRYDGVMAIMVYDDTQRGERRLLTYLLMAMMNFELSVCEWLSIQVALCF
jgi:hypothetical protein